MLIQFYRLSLFSCVFYNQHVRHVEVLWKQFYMDSQLLLEFTSIRYKSSNFCSILFLSTII